MARKKRDFSIFSLSFLDIMSCGFGAVILFFVIINHATETRSDDMSADLSGEVSLLETEVQLEELNKTKLLNALNELETEIVQADGRAERLLNEYEDDREELSEREDETAAKMEHINQLIAELRATEDQLAKLSEEDLEGGQGVRQFYGEGDRQYLTGLRVGGRNIAVFVDASASMLDNTIVNIIRRRNLPDEQKKRSAKWQKALRTVDWITTQFPTDSKFQIYTFNTQTRPALPDTDGQWLPVEQGRLLDESVLALRKVIPQDGTRFYAVAEKIREMDPLPDNVFLIIDSLPTQGREPADRLEAVSSKQRQNFLEQAVRQIPSGIPINVILFPMEGDPLAASSYWKLAIVSGGSFMSPSEDWP